MSAQREQSFSAVQNVPLRLPKFAPRRFGANWTWNANGFISISFSKFLSSALKQQKNLAASGQRFISHDLEEKAFTDQSEWIKMEKKTRREKD